MNKENYEEIARIIKKDLIDNDLPDTAEEIAGHLSEYFDKEVLSHRKKRSDKGLHGCPSNCWCWDFSKIQFLKDCGVEQ